MTDKAQQVAVATTEQPHAEALPAVRAGMGLGLLATDELSQLKQQATIFFNSGLLSERFKNLESVMVAAMYGRELGISMQRALSEIHVVSGRPGISANLMLALIRERMPQAEIVILETSPLRCRIKARRNKSEEFSEFSFCLDDAKRAGLVKDGSGWAKYPEDLNFARTATRMGRRLFSDILNGYGYTPEELQTVDEKPDPLATALRAASVIPKRGQVPQGKVVDEAPTATPTAEEAPALPTAPATDTTLPPAAEPAAPAAAAPAAKPEPQQAALADLHAALDSTDVQSSLERAYEAFRAKHAGDGATLLAGFRLYKNRLAALTAPAGDQPSLL